MSVDWPGKGPKKIKNKLPAQQSEIFAGWAAKEGQRVRK
jgi:hypothetical protein